MDDEWRVARHPMHRPWLAVDKVHTEVLGFKQPNPPYRGVGPGLSFALRMEAYTGVPQGLIAARTAAPQCGNGIPALKGQGGDKSLYGAMLRRFQVCGAMCADCSGTRAARTLGSGQETCLLSAPAAFFAECRRISVRSCRSFRYSSHGW